MFAPGEQRPGYSERVLATQPTNLIGYWPMNEGGGAVAKDYSREGNNGAYTGVDLAQVGIGDGTVCPWFDGTNDYNNIYSAGLAADFNGAAGTLLCWAKVNSAAVWTDGATRKIFSLAVDAATNFMTIGKSPSNNRINWEYVAGGTSSGLGVSGYSDPNWHCLALTWDLVASRISGYRDGIRVVTNTGLGTWSGALTSWRVAIGARTNVPNDVWHGWLAHAALWKTALTPSEVYALGRL